MLLNEYSFSKVVLLAVLDIENKGSITLFSIISDIEVNPVNLYPCM